MAAVDKTAEVCGMILVIIWLWITRQASAQSAYATCYKWTNTYRVTSYCNRRDRTKCCYETCCNAQSYSSLFSFVTCPHPTYNTLFKRVCKDYQKTNCCPHVQRYRYATTKTTMSWWSTCCYAKLTTSKVATYETCHGSYSTGYCTDTFSTYCCYESCCGWGEHFFVFRFSTCDRSTTCRDYRSTSCCTETMSTYPWQLTSCCRSRTATTSSATKDDFPSTGTNVSATGGSIAAAVIIVVTLILVSAVVCARRSARRNLRTNANRASAGPSVSALDCTSVVSAITQTTGPTVSQPSRRAYVNPAMQFPDLLHSNSPRPQAQAPNSYAEPPPAYDAAVSMTELRVPPFNPDKDPPPYDPGNYPQILAVTPSAPPLYTSGPMPNVGPSGS